MGRTVMSLSVPIPTSLPGSVMVEMVASVFSLSRGEIERQEIIFASGPTWVSSPYIDREVFFQTKGTKPGVEASLQETIEINSVPYDIYLAVDQFNRKKE